MKNARRFRPAPAAQLALAFPAPVADDFGTELVRIQIDARAQSQAVFAPYRYLMTTRANDAA